MKREKMQNERYNDTKNDMGRSIENDINSGTINDAKGDIKSNTEMDSNNESCKDRCDNEGKCLSGQGDSGVCAKKEQTPDTEDAGNKKADEDANRELESVKSQLADMSKKCEEYFNMLQRTAAEFDNYKKRTAREKENLYSEAVCDAVAVFLPVMDSVYRALQVFGTEKEKKPLKEDFEIVYKQISEILKSLGVEAIKSVGEKFNPEYHNAVMHITDESQDQNVIVEEFQKGYMLKDRVIRYSMVKVAN